jgi:4'-phosphopantetheinyl transferase EntD
LLVPSWRATVAVEVGHSSPAGWTAQPLVTPAFADVHCVLAQPRAEAPRPADRSWLTPEERRLATAMAPRRRSDWLAGRMAAKLAIGAAIGATAELAELSVSHAAGGRPLALLDGAEIPGLWLAISHSRGAGLATARRGGRPIGTDLEHHAAWSDELAGYAFAASERSSQPGDPSALARWALKEAALKALGTGLILHPRRVGIAADCSSAAGVASWRLVVPGTGLCAGRGWFQHRGELVWALAEVGQLITFPH